MNSQVYGTVPTETFSDFTLEKRRICWGSIAAGSVVTLVAQLCFGILGIAIGASTIDPLVEPNPLAGIGMGSAIWWIVSGTISLYLGGWVAGKASGSKLTRREKGMCQGSMHGVVTWSAVTLLTFYFISSSIGSAMGGAASALGKGLGLAGQAVSTSGTKAKNAAEEFMKSQGIEVPSFDISEVRTQAEMLLRDTGKPQLQPDQLKAQSDQAANEAQSSLNQGMNNPANSDEKFQSLFDKIYAQAEGTANAADKDALINIVAKRKNVSREEATQIVNNWEKTYNDLKAKFEDAKRIAEQKAREAADKVAEVTSKSAFALFFMLLLGAVAAVIGGRVGSSCNNNHYSSVTK